MTTADQIRGTVADYMAALTAREPKRVAALYAENATLEDPVGGGEVCRGREAIESFYTPVAAIPMTAELLTIRVAGSEAAFQFRVVTDLGGQKAVIEPIDVMTFDDDGFITSMKAYWGDGDITMS
jgi:steroid delta-isomerase